MTLIDRERVISWLKTLATLYHAQLGLTDKGSAIKKLAVFLDLLSIIPSMFGQKKVVGPDVKVSWNWTATLP